MRAKAATEPATAPHSERVNGEAAHRNPIGRRPARTALAFDEPGGDIRYLGSIVAGAKRPSTYPDGRIVPNSPDRLAARRQERHPL